MKPDVAFFGEIEPTEAICPSIFLAVGISEEARIDIIYIIQIVYPDVKTMNIYFNKIDMFLYPVGITKCTFKKFFTCLIE